MSKYGKKVMNECKHDLILLANGFAWGTSSKVNNLLKCTKCLSTFEQRRCGLIKIENDI